MLKAEMKRRALAAGLTKFWKNSVLRPEAIQWLKSNPVSDFSSVQFLLKTEAEVYKTLKEMSEEAKTMEQEKLSQANWTGPRPWLRLYICACSDKARKALLVKDDCMGVDELDARHHEDRPLTFDEAGGCRTVQ
jgi:hypothetical protein